MTIEKSDKKLAILSFHKIGEPPSGGMNTWFYTPEETFARQLVYLRTNGWEVIDQSRFLRGLEDPEGLPHCCALITFDDGYRSMRTVVLPLLRRFGFPAILFVPTDYIGGRNTFDSGSEPDESICDWDDLKELERGGVSIQPHGVSHRRFSELDLEQQKVELQHSKAAIEDRLGRRAEIFAFPYGDDGMNPQIVRQELEHAGYRAACLYRGGPMSFPLANPYRLPRLAMGPTTDLEAALVRGEFIPLPQRVGILGEQ
jgi:peptidoglycan/xylan/chitin deacetylase (PgdA/CDA1 family)